jgi:thermitase
MKKFVYGTMMLVLFFFSAQVLGQENASINGQRYIADEVIIKFTSEINIKKSSGIKSMQNFASGENLIPQENIPAQNITVMKIEDGQDVMTVIQDLQNNPSVEYSQPNFLYTLQATDPNDPGFSHQR